MRVIARFELLVGGGRKRAGSLCASVRWLCKSEGGCGVGVQDEQDCARGRGRKKEERKEDDDDDEEEEGANEPN